MLEGFRSGEQRQSLSRIDLRCLSRTHIEVASVKAVGVVQPAAEAGAGHILDLVVADVSSGVPSRRWDLNQSVLDIQYQEGNHAYQLVGIEAL